MKTKHILPKEQNKIITKERLQFHENDVFVPFFLTYLKDVIVLIRCSGGFTFKRMADSVPLFPFDSLNGLELIGDHYRDDMMEWYHVPPQRAVQAEGHER